MHFPPLDNESEMDTAYHRGDTSQSESGVHPGAYPTSAQQRDGDIDPEAEAYGPRYTPSAEHLPSPMHTDDYVSRTELNSDPLREPYVAWTAEHQIPLSEQ